MVNHSWNTPFVLLAMAFLLLLTACSGRHQQVIRDVSVRLYVAGNEPFTRLMAEFADGKTMEISPQSPDYQKLWSLQTRTIRIIEAQLISQNDQRMLLIREFEMEGVK
ncbi:MAG: hypothetical protein GXO78_00025 [Calditrichaeota bacterium]|nr:hypothetical protein [Calditrichota bacterium]